ncbi:MAG: glycosyltransferase family 4 protein [Acidobacteriia bacterium]|nr:glycosyltransferase family 4 protein [Terriglobia bacterium]
MNIVAVYAEDYPWDIRVEKLLVGFQNAGHTTHLVCRNRALRPANERVGNILCKRVPAPVLPRALASLISTPAFFNPMWAAAVRRCIRDARPELVVVRDLPLAPLAIRLANSAGIAVIVDMAENHPALWREVCASDPIPLRSWILKNPYLARRMERSVARRAHGFFVVVEEMREHLLALGVPPERVAVVSNTPELMSFDASGGSMPPDTFPPLSPHHVDLLYVGNVTRRRGLHQVVAAMAELREDDPMPRLHVVGDGDYLPRLRELAAKMKLAGRVFFHGRIEFARVPAIFARCHVGVISHLKTEHTDTTIPNKLFDCMACAKPVLVSNATPLERIVTAEDCGRVFRDGDIAGIANQIRALLDPELRRRLGANGRSAVERRYNWGRDMETALAAVQRFTRSPLSSR